jgi:hypothetical protein
MYLSQAEFEDFVKRSLTSDEATTFIIAEKAAEKYIDNFCDTNFNQVEASARYYDGGCRELTIDPCTNITKVEYVDASLGISSELDEDDYVQEPHHKTVKWSLRNRYGKFQSGMRNVKVTAKFSSYINEIPSEIKLACAILIQGMINNPSGYKKESLEGYSYELESIEKQDDRVITLLTPYRRIEL